MQKGTRTPRRALAPALAAVELVGGHTLANTKDPRTPGPGGERPPYLMVGFLQYLVRTVTYAEAPVSPSVFSRDVLSDVPTHT